MRAATPHNRALFALVLLLACLLSTGRAFAVDPASLEVGPVYLTPTAEARAGYLDNLLRSDGDEQSTAFTIISPKIRAWAQSHNNVYALSYEIRDLRYADSKQDNYTDHFVDLEIHHEFNAKNVLDVFGEYDDGHEERGIGLSEGEIGDLLPAPIEYERSRFGGFYSYGNANSRARVVLGADILNYDYQNFEEFTQYRNRDHVSYFGEVFFKVAPRTEILAQVRAIETEYEDFNPLWEGGSLDSEELNYMVGINWDASGKTRGSVRLGQFEREFDSAGRQDDEGFHWEAALDWRPRSYSHLNVETRRFSQENNGLGDYINTEELSAQWVHNWSGRTRTTVRGLLADDDYSGSFRKDERIDAEAIFTYAFRRWLDLGLGYRYEARESDEDNRDYQRNMVFFEAELSL